MNSQLIVLVVIALFCACHSVQRNLAETKKSTLGWCPPAKFVENKKKAARNIRTAIITEIHGELQPAHWGTLINGNILSRNLFHHLGVMGFDKMYLNYIYNDTQHPTPPTIEEMYPPENSCVSAWFKTGIIQIRYIPYAGPVERWPLTEEGKPSTEKDLYKTLRGINPAYAEIMKKKEADWVMILDIDEYLWPVNFSPTKLDWCSSKYPTIMEMAIQQMQMVATKVDLQDFKKMKANDGKVRDAVDACMLGYGVSTAHAKPKCQPIASIIMPVKFWTKDKEQSKGSLMRTRHMPNIRSKVYASYDLLGQLNTTDENEINGQYQRWKAIHQTKFTPELTGARTMHYGHADSFQIISPRDYHKAMTLEIAHIKRQCGPDCINLLVRDDTLDDLSRIYNRCMTKI